MTEDDRRRFEDAWPSLAARLSARLAKRNVPQAIRDDVVQETALRLLEMWERVDASRSPWPLVVTIAGNLLWDDANRKSTREVPGVAGDELARSDVEEAAMARAELSNVSRAMRQLTKSQREALLAEVGASDIAASVSPDALKMLRMRARRRLAVILERVPLPAAAWAKTKAAFVHATRAGDAPGAFAGFALYATILFVALPPGGFPGGGPDPAPRLNPPPGGRAVNASSVAPGPDRDRRPAGTVPRAAAAGEGRPMPETPVRDPTGAPRPGGPARLVPPGAHSGGYFDGPVEVRNSATVWRDERKPRGRTGCRLLRRDPHTTTASCEVSTTRGRARVRVIVRR